MVTHEYTLSKGFFTTILTVVGIGIVLFLTLLFFTVIQQVIVFLNEIYAEFAFRK